MKKWVYLFSEITNAEKYAGNWDNIRALLGSKGTGMADMFRANIPIPPNFTVTTEASNAFYKKGYFPKGMWHQELAALKEIEKLTNKSFGDPTNPLLVSCRSGAKFSMPGMMETVLNLGLTDVTAAGMVKLTGNERFVYDSYRRLVEMFGSVVLGIPDESFEQPLHEYKHKKGYKLDTEMTADDWKAIVEAFKAVIRKEKGFDFPQDPYKQLELATEAVFKSWNGKRAIAYRKKEGISDDLGVAVNIVTMVFGNMGDDSGTGVAFTRNPSTGDKKMMGEYLRNAQGEDVVFGIRNPDPIENLEFQMPNVYKHLMSVASKLEKHYKDMQDFEFTIERGNLWILQSRNGKRTAKAAVKMAVDMANEGLIKREDAIMRVTPEHIDTLLHPEMTFDHKGTGLLSDHDEIPFDGSNYIAKGIGLSSSIVTGKVYFDAERAEKAAGEDHEDVILAKPFCRAEDIHGMLASKGIFTIEGGSTSQAAIVAKNFNIPCIIGVTDLSIDISSQSMSARNMVIREGDIISLDSSHGKIYLGTPLYKSQLVIGNPLDRIIVEPGRIDGNIALSTLLNWADKICLSPKHLNGSGNRRKKGFQVWANSDYPKDVSRARSYGAVGIGLCRTEHMFFEPERLPIVQRMFLAETSEERTAALNELLPYQIQDFDGLFEAINGYPIVIRLLDPPMHEFMPDEEKLLEDVITMRVKDETEGLQEKENLLNATKGMHESNPIMGLRGIRLGIVIPEIIEMQIFAIFEAAANCTLRGIVVKPELMIPMTGTVKEIEWLQPKLERIASTVMREKKVKFDYKVGTMIEVPRAAVTAGEIAKRAQFFSFGTNDLTQMIYGYSRDDAERNFLITYQEQGILERNPFQTLDRTGVGKFMEWAINEGRKTRPDLQIGICGEHGGDPQSIEFCYLLGLNYVSCSPFRIPIARLSAARAILKHQKQDKQ